jgi:adenosine deaminase CECR1
MSFEKDRELDSLELILESALIQLTNEMIDDYKEQHFFPPARYFFQSKPHIEETKLFKILKTMPKGGILHLHGAAAGNARWVVDRVISEPNCYVYWGAHSESYVKGQLGFFQENLAPPGFEQAALLMNRVSNFPDSLFSLLTFDESIDADSVDIWKEFEQIFQRIYRFIRYQPVFKDYFYHSFEQLVDDGIQHVELRGIFTDLYDLQHPDGYYNADSIVRYFQEATNRIKEKEPSFTLKIIFTSLRFKSKLEIEQDLIAAYKLRGRYPDLVAGFDLVAEEDQGHSTLYFLDTWLKMDSLQQYYGVDMPLYLHDGESDWVSVNNLYDAVLLDSRRIGHGFNLFRFPNLLEEVKRRDICLELNPISNQILGYVRDLRMHPGSTYLTRGVACTISSDDPLIFDYQGLTYDYWEIFLAWELDLRKLKGLVLNSLKYSALDQQQKARALQYFNEEWSRFVVFAVNELGGN